MISSHLAVMKSSKQRVLPNVSHNSRVVFWKQVLKFLVSRQQMFVKPSWYSISQLFSKQILTDLCWKTPIYRIPRSVAAAKRRSLHKFVPNLFGWELLRILQMAKHSPTMMKHDATAIQKSVGNIPPTAFLVALPPGCSKLPRLNRMSLELKIESKSLSWPLCPSKLLLPLPRNHPWPFWGGLQVICFWKKHMDPKRSLSVMFSAARICCRR